jgi:hypothetical protein
MAALQRKPDGSDLINLIFFSLSLSLLAIVCLSIKRKGDEYPSATGSDSPQICTHTHTHTHALLFCSFDFIVLVLKKNVNNVKWRIANSGSGYHAHERVRATGQRGVGGGRRVLFNQSSFDLSLLRGRIEPPGHDA